MISRRNFGCRLRDFVWRDHRCITLENEAVRLLVAADKGADILEFLYKPTDTECLWSSPAGLQPRHFRPSSPLETGHFREYFAGGWYEMLPNGPAPCEHRGAKWGYHGEATLLPWDVRFLADSPERIAVEFTARLNRIPLRVEKTMELRRGTSTLSITECIHNESGQPVEFLWGHHPTFGGPLLEPGARIVVPPCEAIIGDRLAADARLAPSQRCAWPNVRGRNGESVDLSVVPSYDSASHDFVRLESLTTGSFAVFNPARHCGFSLRFDRERFPVLGYWQLFHGGPDYPWYGQHFLAALEPACDLPSLSEAAAQRTAITLAGGAEITTTLEAGIITEMS
jgi:hypothetical protein